MRKKLFFIITAVLLFFIASRIFTLREGVIDQLIAYATYPILVLQKKLIYPLHFFFHKRTVMHDIFNAYEKKVHELQNVYAENIMLHALLHESECFHELIVFKQRYYSHFAIPAHVLFKHIDVDEHFFLIDKGLSHGVQKDMIVVFKNMLIGRVTQVFERYSKVILCTDRQSKIPALCTGTHALGIHEGINNIDSTRLSFVSHLETIKLHDLVIARGEGLVYPKGFALGRIKAFEKQGLQYEIIVEPLIAIAMIDNVYIIQPGAEYQIS